MEDKIIYIILAIVNCFIGAIAAFALKKSTMKIKKIIPIKTGIKQIWYSGVLLGVFIYAFTAIVSIYILTKLEVLVFYPLTSMTYVFSFILAKKYLNEQITINKIIGIILIIIGVIFIV